VENIKSGELRGLVKLLKRGAPGKGAEGRKEGGDEFHFES